MDDPRALFTGLRPVSLDVMNDRAALQRRTDHKYVVPLDHLARLIEDLRDEHEVLEIDGEQVFAYESTYFDTASLQCFWDHVRDRRPRYKARTRCYLATGDCFFEVKVKGEDDEMTKRSVDYDPDERDAIVPAGSELLTDVLSECGLDTPEDLRPSLITAFRRVTVVAREQPQRTTFDFGLGLRVPERNTAQFEGQYAIVETKTPEGDGAWDRGLADAGLEPVSLSKYRIGTGLLHAAGDDSEYAPELKELFKVCTESR